MRLNFRQIIGFYVVGMNVVLFHIMLITVLKSCLKEKILLLTVLINIMLITLLFLCLLAFVQPDNISCDWKGSTKKTGDKSDNLCSKSTDTTGVDVIIERSKFISEPQVVTAFDLF